ncbi:MAG: flagellar hook assembly protein FlgD [Pseudomonadota bacterium]
METGSIADYQALGLATQANTGNGNDLGQDAFLELMVTQFQNQDPFAPMENGEFLSQIAQFTTATGIDELQASFNNVAASINSDQALAASSMICRDVLVAMPVGVLESGAGMAGAVQVPVETPVVAVDVVDSAGQVVRTLNLGEQSPGLANFEWDGVTASGEQAPPGQYAFEARVQADGVMQNTNVMVEARVSSVNVGGAGGGITLNIDGLGALSMADVLQIL